MRKLWTLVAAVAFVAPVSHAEEASRKGSVDSSRLNVASMVQHCDLDAMLQMTGTIFRDRDPKSLMQDVAREWNRIGKAPREPATCLHRPDVQLYLADALAQGVWNGFEIDVDVKAIASLLRTQINNADPALAFTAITGLSYVAEASDRKLFSELIRPSSGSRRLAAIQALALDCSPEADALLRAAADPDVLAEAAKYSAVRQLRCGSRKP